MRIFQTITLTSHFYPTEIPSRRTTWKRWCKGNGNNRYDFPKPYPLSCFYFIKSVFNFSFSYLHQHQWWDKPKTWLHKISYLPFNCPEYPLISESIDDNWGILQTPSYQPLETSLTLISYSFSLLDCILHRYALLREFLPWSDQSLKAVFMDLLQPTDQ